MELCCPEAQPVLIPCAERQRLRPPVSYVLVGPVAVVSLDERLEGREADVAAALLRIPGVRAVYGKVATEGVYRAQRLIHLAGEKLEEVIYVEHGLRYPVPLGRVYVNPRLATEHARIAALIRRRENVLDMFSGIGGFSLLAAATGKPRLVVANDANPDAYRSLVRAAVMNRGRLRCPVIAFNLDAVLLPDILRPVFTRIIMNLPHSSLDFIDVAYKLCSSMGCVIHVYLVARGSREAAEAVRPRLPPRASIASIARVLDYAPGKYIYRIDVAVRGVGDVEH